MLYFQCADLFVSWAWVYRGPTISFTRPMAANCTNNPPKWKSYIMWRGHPEEQSFRGADSYTRLCAPLADPFSHQKDGQGMPPSQRPPSRCGHSADPQPFGKALPGTTIWWLSCLSVHIHSGLSEMTKFLYTEQHQSSRPQETYTSPTPDSTWLFSKSRLHATPTRVLLSIKQTDRNKNGAIFFLQWGSFQSWFR